MTLRGRAEPPEAPKTKVEPETHAHEAPSKHPEIPIPTVKKATAKP